jgi:hypothetical protein
MSDVIVQFPLIAYGRMFTPDWEHVLNFHIICCMIRVWKLVEKDLFPGMETATCFLLKELVEWFILLFCNLGIYRGPRPYMIQGTQPSLKST